MKTSDIIIIGAGASGLMAAYTLAKAGKKVTVLEARNRIGGRIHTTNTTGFTKPVELGAEFVHGNLPVTLGLLKEAGIPTTHVGFEMWQHHQGTLSQSEAFFEGFDAFLKKLNALETDMPMAAFLAEYFSGSRYAALRAQVESYVAGYDTADINDVSAFALRNEYNHEDEDAQHRIVGGYAAMTNYLANVCTDNGGEILLNHVVTAVNWKPGSVEVVTANGQNYAADKLVVALPLGVLQANATHKGAISFSPPISAQVAALNNIGFGAIIKILLEFNTAFWEAEMFAGDRANLGFLLSDETVPTYWTQSPARSPLLTGWLGGPPAYALKDMPDEDILALTLQSVAVIFKIDVEMLKNNLVAWQVANWTTEAYTRGSYAYDTVKSPEARKVLGQPVSDTIYFTGEYLYDGPAMGTVEAALTSGKRVGNALSGLHK